MKFFASAPLEVLRRESRRVWEICLLAWVLDCVAGRSVSPSLVLLVAGIVERMLMFRGHRIRRAVEFYQSCS